MHYVVFLDLMKLGWIQLTAHSLAGTCQFLQLANYITYIHIHHIIIIMHTFMNARIAQIEFCWVHIPRTVYYTTNVVKSLYAYCTGEGAKHETK